MADVPDAPTTAPTRGTGSSASKLIADYSAMSTSENGGSAILSYSLEFDDNSTGVFTPITGYSSD